MGKTNKNIFKSLFILASLCGGLGGVLAQEAMAEELPMPIPFWVPFGASCGDGVVQPKIPGDMKCENVRTGLTFDEFLNEPFFEGCENGQPFFREQCDDGNNTDGDGCSATCQLERVGTPSLKENQNQDNVTPSKLFTQEQQRVYEVPLVTTMDNAGNVDINNELQTLNIKIDITPPVFSPVECFSGLETFDSSGTSQGIQTELSYPTEALFSSDGRDKWTNQNITCSYTVDDPNHDYNSQLKTWWNTLSPDTTTPPTGNVQYWDIVDFEGVRTVDSATGAVTSTVTTIALGLDASMMDAEEIRSEYEFYEEQEAYYMYSGQAEDHAGNLSDANPNTEGSQPVEQEFVIKIDKTSPVFTSAGIQLSNGEAPRSLSSSTPEVFEAHEEFKIYLNVEDPTVVGSASGVNLERSFITLAHETDSTLSLSSALSDAGIEFESPIGKNITSPIIIGDNSDLFEKAGDYKLSVIIRDKAENILVSEEMLIKIVASEVDEDMSTMFIQGKCLGKSDELTTYLETPISTDDSCQTGEIYANNSDVCPIKMEFKDRFGNPIINRPVTLSLEGQVLNRTEYDLTTNANVAFVNGLRLQDTIADTGTTGTKTFSVKSFIPTIEVVPASNPFEEAYLMRRVYKNIPLKIKTQQVLRNGDLDSGTEWTQLPGTNINKYNPPAIFEPWVKLFLSDSAGTLGPADDHLYFLPGQQFVYGHAFTVAVLDKSDAGALNLNNVGIDLPRDITVSIAPHLRGEAEMVYQDSEERVKDYNTPYTVPYTGEIKYEIKPDPASNSEIYLILPPGVISVQTYVAFHSAIKYSIQEGGSTRTITYPGGNLGNKLGEGDGAESLFPSSMLFDEADDGVDMPDGQCLSGWDNSLIEILKIGADIEGQIMTRDEESFSIAEGAIAVDDSRAVQMGRMTQIDSRETITRNAYELIRGKTPEDADDNDFDVTDCSDGQVFYFKSSSTPVTITGGTADSPAVVSGTCTVVLEDRNLSITGDFIYDNSPEASIGFILINSTYEPYPESGNIFIKNTVERFVGTYFADGTLTSTDLLLGLNISSVSSLDRNSTSALSIQLLLEGTLFTRNTLGGSSISDMVDPWGSSTDKDQAQLYDLDYVRRYNAIRYKKPSGEQMTRQSPNPCVKGTGSGGCDANLHSFVIRVDGRAQTVPPPGFGQ